MTSTSMPISWDRWSSPRAMRNGLRHGRRCRISGSRGELDLRYTCAGPMPRPIATRVRAHAHGLELSEERVVPLWVGAMHYWRHPPSDWGAGLDAIKAMGLKLVDTYVPWGV